MSFVGQCCICIIGMFFVFAALYRVAKVRFLFKNCLTATGEVVDSVRIGRMWAETYWFTSAEGKDVMATNYIAEDDADRCYKAVKERKKREVMYVASNPEICIAKSDYVILHFKMIVIFVIGIVATLLGVCGF